MPRLLSKEKSWETCKEISFDFSSELSEEMEISPVDFETPWKPYGRFCYFRVRLLPWAWTRQPSNLLPQMGQVLPPMQFYSLCLVNPFVNKNNLLFVWRSSQCPPIGRILFFSVPSSNFFILVPFKKCYWTWLVILQGPSTLHGELLPEQW